MDVFNHPVLALANVFGGVFTMLAPCCGCLNVVRLNDSCALRQADITDEARRQIEMRRQDKCYEWKAAVISGTLWGWLLSMVVLLLAGSSSAHRALVYLSIVYALLGALQGGVLLAIPMFMCRCCRKEENDAAAFMA